MKVDVRKQGSVFTVFVDPGTGQPVQYSPGVAPLGFPMTYRGFEAVRASYPGYEFNIVEDHIAPAIVEYEPEVDEAELARAAMDAKRGVQKPMESKPEAKPAQDLDAGIEYVLNVFREFVISESDKNRVEAVTEFLVNLAPELEDHILSIARGSSTKPSWRKIKL